MSESTGSVEREPHTLAHRVSLGVSIAVLIALAFALVSGASGDDPARPVAEIIAVEVAGGGAHHVMVAVSNEGDRAAESVQVSASLTIGDEEQTGDQTIDFLGAGEQQTLVFVFRDDPAAGDLEIAVTSFAEP